MDQKEALKSMLQDVINDKMEQASVTMHDYFVAKTREVTGLAKTHEPDLDDLTEGHNGDVTDVLEALGMSLQEFQALSQPERRHALVRVSESNEQDPTFAHKVLRMDRLFGPNAASRKR